MKWPFLRKKVAPNEQGNPKDPASLTTSSASQTISSSVDPAAAVQSTSPSPAQKNPSAEPSLSDRFAARQREREKEVSGAEDEHNAAKNAVESTQRHAQNLDANSARVSVYDTDAPKTRADNVTSSTAIDEAPTRMVSSKERKAFFAQALKAHQSTSHERAKVLHDDITKRKQEKLALIEAKKAKIEAVRLAKIEKKRARQEQRNAVNIEKFREKEAQKSEQEGLSHVGQQLKAATKDLEASVIQATAKANAPAPKSTPRIFSFIKNGLSTALHKVRAKHAAPDAEHPSKATLEERAKTAVQNIEKSTKKSIAVTKNSETQDAIGTSAREDTNDFTRLHNIQEKALGEKELTSDEKSSLSKRFAFIPAARQVFFSLSGVYFIRKVLAQRKQDAAQKIRLAKLSEKHSVELTPLKKKKKEKISRSQRRRNLSMYLNKAGYFDVDVEKLKKRIRFFLLNLVFAAWVIPLAMAVINERSLAFFLPYTLAIWTVGFMLLWLVVWGTIYFYLEMRMYNRTKELEDVLPDFLQLTSTNISAGMPIDRALWLAIRPSFGILAKEIEDVAKATLTGEDLVESLQKLVGRYDSTLLKRSISILVEGLNSGGELSDLLSKIALNIQEIKIMKKEMAANVTTYAIFISFASVGIAPILFALATQLIDVVLSITSSLSLADSGSSFTVASGNSNITKNFKIYCMFMLSVTAGMSAAIISVIQRGNVRDGIRNIPIFIIISLIIYFSMSSFFGGMMSGIAP